MNKTLLVPHVSGDAQSPVVPSPWFCYKTTHTAAILQHISLEFKTKENISHKGVSVNIPVLFHTDIIKRMLTTQPKSRSPPLGHVSENDSGISVRHKELIPFKDIKGAVLRL